ncbi:MAG: DcaP family trimeric outer membrane transporter, partial [Lysobacter sp.]
MSTSTATAGIATAAIAPPLGRRPLTAALLVALALPGAAFAQTAKERELEARVVQLEAMVQQPVSAQQQQQAAIGEVRTAQAQTAIATPGKPTLQTAPITPGANPGTAFSYGGFIKLDAMYTDTTGGEIADGSAGRLFYLPGAIPVGGADEGGGDTDMHAQFSRFWFSADTALDSGSKLKAYIELDLFGGGNNAFLGNEVATNTHGVTLRHAYVSWNEWLAGQTWSNFQDVAALPEAVDFIGPTEGTTFVRQAQVRYTKGPWSFSLENPETTITPYLNAGARIASDDNSMPDLTARWISKGTWGHFTVAGLLRQFKYQNASANIDESATGGAVSVSGKFNLGGYDDLRYMVSGGSGIGRYLGLGLGSDTLTRADGTLEPLDGLGGFVAWRHAFSPKLRSNLMLSAAQFDNDTAISGLGVTESAQSWHANLIYSPLPKLDIGAELIWG